MPLSEDDRTALSAAVFLALYDAGKTGWPGPQIDAAASCPRSQFVQDGLTWTISGGTGETPVRWARARGMEETLFLAPGPALVDARKWVLAGRRGPHELTHPPVYYLVGILDKRRYVFQIYDGLPDDRRLAKDIAAATSLDAKALAVFDAEGDAVSLLVETQSGRAAELFQPANLDGRVSATLFAPDGHYFVKGERGSVVMRAANHPCAARYGAFTRETMSVMNTQDASLDLACSFHAEYSWITMFSTRRPDRQDDRSNFRARLKEAQSEGVRKMLTKGIDRGPDGSWTGQVWLDKKGILQALWITRRGDYVVELYATFTSNDADDVFHAAPHLLGGTLPDGAARETDGRG